MLALSQITPETASAWADVPMVGLLIMALGAVVVAFVWEWIVPGFRYKQKVEECEQLNSQLEKERRKAEEVQARHEQVIVEWQEKYAGLLQSNIEEWKQRDRTLDMLTQLASKGKVEKP